MATDALVCGSAVRGVPVVFADVPFVDQWSVVSKTGFVVFGVGIGVVSLRGSLVFTLVGCAGTFVSMVEPFVGCAEIFVVAGAAEDSTADCVAGSGEGSRFQPGVPRFQPGVPRFQPGVPRFQPGVPRFQPGVPSTSTTPASSRRSMARAQAVAGRMERISFLDTQCAQDGHRDVPWLTRRAERTKLRSCMACGVGVRALV